ncbi:GNAT family N-acetyltransferase [Brevibacillus humidisoli]|uniref:GNAT family N-acetyltransferase n=1 Tax=Brevibacillus humidisoli TaxID=2895522 RepID=UPI001E5B6435|nr:GNAT family N-acetyltransferase [Brevibacillus humidisoli]UFJ42312.1 GNAT family N-acetyltransferase [Brevibacillus humidisoli]
MLTIQPVTLIGSHVRLEPLGLHHADDLLEAALDERIWTYMSTRIESRSDLDRYLSAALAAVEKGTELPFAIIDLQSGKAIGSTRFGNIAHKDRGLEIGWTWLTPAYWKTSINTECKWLLLRHCFEELGCVRVSLKTDARNLNSQRAIARIGGVREGVLRKHIILPDGYVRDTVYFSVIDTEWPEVDRKLRDMLAR